MSNQRLVNLCIDFVFKQLFGTSGNENITQVEFLSQPYGCFLLHLDKPMKIHPGVEMQLNLKYEYA